jgi:hypothetical protein
MESSNIEDPCLKSLRFIFFSPLHGLLFSFLPRLVPYVKIVLVGQQGTCKTTVNRRKAVTVKAKGKDMCGWQEQIRTDVVLLVNKDKAKAKQRSS